MKHLSPDFFDFRQLSLWEVAESCSVLQMPFTPTTATVEPAGVAIDGGKVRELRKLAGKSMGDLAESCGISVQYMSAIERGDRLSCSPPVFGRICDALDITDRRELLRQAAA